MDRVVTNLSEVVRKEVSSYATEGYNGAGERSRLYYTENQQDQVFSVLAPYDPAYKRADLVMMARIVNDQVIIDVDKTSKPLYDALKRAGVPERQIVVAWKPK
jgi:hypothetical protein